MHPVFGPITEHGEQVRVFQWAKQMSMYAPELALLYAVPNEKRSGWKVKGDGSRYNPDLTYMLQEGLKGGVPDVCLPVARQGYHSFYIENKVGDNVPSEAQWAWMIALVEQGHRVDICYDADQAIRALCEYLDIQVRFM